MAKNEFDITSLTPEQRDARLALDVERLLRFGRKHKLIKDLDILVARNTLLDLLALAAPSEAKPPKEDMLILPVLTSSVSTSDSEVSRPIMTW